MITRQRLLSWLVTIPDNADIYIDEGGLTLYAAVPGWDERPYLKVGGDPEEDEGWLEDVNP